MMTKNVAILFFLVFFSCTNNTKQQEYDLLSHFELYGDSIDEKGAVTMSRFLSEVDSSGSDSVKVLAKITECCQKKGCWMKVDLGGGKTMQVTFKDYGFFMPLDCANKEAILFGKAYYDTVTVDVLKHYAKDAGKTQEEIDAITQPEYQLSFEASGVLLKK